MPVLLLLAAVFSADAEPKTPKDALQAFNAFVGSWKCTGYPEGTKEERAAGFWQETIAWEWLFKKDDVALVGTIEKGKYYTKLELRYIPDKKHYQLLATTPDKATHTYTGLLTAGKQKESILTLDRSDDTGPLVQRLVFTILHSNRYLYRYDTRPASAKAFARQYQVGATKEGEAFATSSTDKECIVSGGLGKIPVSHKGTTYYVCCSGCKDAFKDDPEKYIKEWEAKQAKKK